LLRRTHSYRFSPAAADTDLQDVYEDPIIAEKESCEVFIGILRVRLCDDFLQ
jgi:hypothetical protein